MAPMLLGTGDQRSDIVPSPKATHMLLRRAQGRAAGWLFRPQRVEGVHVAGAEGRTEGGERGGEDQ